MCEAIREEQQTIGAAKTAPLVTPTTIETTLAESVIISTEQPSEADQAQVSEDETFPPPRRMFVPNWSNIIACLLLLILIGEHAVPLVWPVIDFYLHPKAVVTIFAARQQQRYTYTFLAVTGTPDRSQNQIASRLVSFTTPTKYTSIQTTGVGYTPAVQATGSVTFYNEAPYSQTVAAGTVVTGSDSIQLVTDATVTIAAGNGGTNGSATTPAHTLQAGTQANIAPLDLNGLCCLAGILAKNLTAFSGGADPQAYPTVSPADLQTAARQLAATVDPQARHGLLTQMAETERPLTPIQCNFTTRSQPKVGERATTAQVTVSETCSSQVYDYGTLQRETQAQFLQGAARQTDSHFIQSGNLSITLMHITLLDSSHHTYKVAVSASGTLIFHLSPTELHRLVTEIAGEKISRAQHQLLAIQGVQGVDIQPAHQGDSMLPAATSQIQIVLS